MDSSSVSSLPLSKAPQRSLLFLACDKRLDIRPEAQKSCYLVVSLKTKNIFQTLEINQLHFPFSLSVRPGSEWPGPWPGGRGPLSCSCVFCRPSVFVLFSSVWVILWFLYFCIFYIFYSPGVQLSTCAGCSKQPVVLHSIFACDNPSYLFIFFEIIANRNVWCCIGGQCWYSQQFMYWLSLHQLS